MAMAMAVATKTTKPTQPTQHNTTHNPVLFYWQLISNLSSAPLSSLHFSLRFAALRFDSIRCLFHNSQFTEGEAEALPPGESPEFLGTQLDIKFLYLPGISVFSVFFFLAMEKSIWWQIFWRCLFFSVSAGAKMRAVWKKAWHKTLAVYIPISFISFSFSVCGGKEQREQKTKNRKKNVKNLIQVQSSCMHAMLTFAKSGADKEKGLGCDIGVGYRVLAWPATTFS